MSIEAAFANTALDKVSDQISDSKHLSNDNYERRDRGIDPTDKKSDRFSDTMRKQSERPDQAQKSEGNKQSDHSHSSNETDNNGEIQEAHTAPTGNEETVDGLEVAELAQLGLITIQSDTTQLPTIDIHFQQGAATPQQQVGLMAQTSQAVAVDTNAEQVLDNGVAAAAMLGTASVTTEQEGNGTTQPIISSLDSETAETLIPAQTEADLDQDSQLTHQQQRNNVPALQTANPQNTQQVENSDAEAEQQIQHVQQASTNSQQSSSTIAGSEQGKIQVQDFQATMNNTKVDTPQTTAQQDLNAMDKAVGKQIERAVVQQLQNGQKVLQIRLTPPELGTVKVEIMEQSGRMTVRLQAEDESVRLSLEKALPQLRGDLRASNAPIADVQLTDHNFLMNQHRQAQQQQQQRRRQQQGQSFELEGVPQTEKTNEPKQEAAGITINSRGVNGIV